MATENNINSISERNGFSIVKLQKNGITEYPVTRPECVVFNDGTTVAGRILQLEDGAKVMWQVYKSVIASESMFTDESVFHEYVAMSFNCLKKSYHGLYYNNSNDACFLWSKNDTVIDNGYVIENSTDDVDDTNKRRAFTLEHFISIMNGFVPKQIVIPRDAYRDNDSVYDRLVSVKSVNFSVRDDINSNNKHYYGDKESVRGIELIMGKTSSPNDNTSDVIVLMFIPCFVAQASPGSDDGVLVNGATIVRNPSVVAYNKRP